MNAHEYDFNCPMLNYLRVNFYHRCCQESAESFAGRMINLNVNEDAGQFLLATKEILHLVSIEETSGENEVRYSLGLPKSCGCRHAGTRGPL